MKQYNTIEHLVCNGKEFVISSCIRRCGKTGYYAHQLGEHTQWAKIFGGGERKAHRVNPSYRANKFWTVKPFATIEQAREAVVRYSEQDIVHF